MDNQCDKCGRILPTKVEKVVVASFGEEDPVEDSQTQYISQHIVTSGENVIKPDQDWDTDWEPENEYDLCPACHAEFVKVFDNWFNNRR